VTLKKIQSGPILPPEELEKSDDLVTLKAAAVGVIVPVDGWEG